MKSGSLGIEMSLALIVLPFQCLVWRLAGFVVCQLVGSLGKVGYFGQEFSGVVVGFLHWLPLCPCSLCLSVWVMLVGM